MTDTPLLEATETEMILPAEQTAVTGLVSTISRRTENQLDTLQKDKKVGKDIKKEGDTLVADLGAVEVFLKGYGANFVADGSHPLTITTDLQPFTADGIPSRGIITYNIVASNDDGSRIEVMASNGKKGSFALVDLLGEATLDLEMHSQNPDLLKRLDLTQTEVDLVIQAAKAKLGEADEVDKTTLIEVAKGMGIPTSEDGKGFVNFHFLEAIQYRAAVASAVPDADGNLPPPPTLTPELQLELDLYDKHYATIMAHLDTHTILTGEDISFILNGTGENSDIYETLIQDSKKVIEDLQSKRLIDASGNFLVKVGDPKPVTQLGEEVKYYTQSEIFTIQNNAQTAQAEIRIYTAAKNKSQDIAQTFDTYIQSIENNTISRAKALEVAQGIRDGDIDAIGEALLKSDVDTEETRIARQKTISEVKKKAKKLGKILGGLAAILIFISILQAGKGASGGGQHPG